MSCKRALFILNKILLNYYYSFLTQKKKEDVNILMFLTYTKIEYF